MTKRVYTATEKSTGRTWTYEQRRTYGRNEFRAVPCMGSWAPTLSGAKEAAKAVDQFRYDGEAPIIRIVA